MWFRKKTEPKAVVVKVANDISIHASHGCNRFKEIMNELVGDLGMEQFLIVYLEFNIFLLHITDKLASNYYGNIQRNEIINKIIDGARQNFCNTQIFDSIITDKGDFFERYFQEAYYSYPPQSLILGKDDNQVTMYFSQRLMELFLKEKIEAQRYYVQTITYEMLELYIKEFLTLKSVSQLLK